MSKVYHYVTYPQKHIKFDFDNALSSERVSNIKQAYDWAEVLMKVDRDADYVLFLAENGWQVYSVRRVNGELVRGKER